MRSFLSLIVIVVISVGCSESPAEKGNVSPKTTVPAGTAVPPEMVEALEATAETPSLGLRKAKVIVHRVYEYHGYPSIDALDTARPIAVDVEFREYDRGLDLNDVDIIDGESNENFGSNPFIARLTLQGEISSKPEDSSWPENLEPMRVLLIYAFPAKANTIKLSYLGKELTAKPITIAGEGPALPKPKPEKSR